MTLGAEFREAVRIAAAALLANRLRSVLTTLGIVIGVVTVTLMGTAIAGINRAFRQSVATIGGDVLFLQRMSWFADEAEWRSSRNRRPLTRDQARDVERLSGQASKVSLEVMGQSAVSQGRRKARSVEIVGTDDRNIEVHGFGLQSGRWLSPGDVQSGRPVCVLGARLADRFFPLGGVLGGRIRIGDARYEVIGVVESQDTFLGGFSRDDLAFIPVTRFTQELSRWPDYTILVKVRDPELMDEAEEELRGILRKLRRIPPERPDDFAINRQEALVSFFNRVGGTMASAGLFITGLSLFVGGIGVMNIMFVSVAERTREIGVRKAIGARRRTILVQFLVEAAGIALAAGFLGLAIAWPLTRVVDRFLIATMPWWLAGVALLVSLVTGVISGLVPAWRAARLDPVEALRSE
ncbi:MAG: ABC transporter permease [Verrucomicrobiae bacterium]|nr:ABC transporter permease [Verrucomicrobiae bacterium]